MSELDDLLAQKRRIDKRIRELKDLTLRNGRTRLTLQKYPRGDEWTVTIEKVSEYANEIRKCTVIQLTDRNEVINELRGLVDDLSGLADKMENDYV